MYKYGMSLRGISIGCLPMEGLIKRQDATTGKYHLGEIEEEDMKKYCIISYSDERGIGAVNVCGSKEEAIREAKAAWIRLTPSEQQKMNEFCIAECPIVNDEPDTTEYTPVWDALNYYYIDYGTGSAVYAMYDLDAAMRAADEGIAYTQTDVKIYEGDNLVAFRHWYDVECPEDEAGGDVIDYGTGYYAEWQVL